MKNKIFIIIAFTLCTILLANDIKHELGRDNDPKTTEDIGSFKLFTKKATWSILSIPGMRFMVDLMFPESSIIYLDIDSKTVAFK